MDRMNLSDRYEMLRMTVTGEYQHLIMSSRLSHVDLPSGCETTLKLSMSVRSRRSLCKPS